MPDDEPPDPEPVKFGGGAEYKEGTVEPGPASMDWPTPEDDDPND
jgi:hypothetical protein